MSGGEAFHFLVFDVDQIAAYAPIVFPELDSLGGSFEWSASGVVFKRTVAQQTHVRDAAARRKMLRRMVRQPNDAVFGNGVHGWSIGCFERRFSIK